MTTTYSIQGYRELYEDDTDELVDDFSPVTLSVTFPDDVTSFSYVTDVFTYQDNEGTQQVPFVEITPDAVSETLGGTPVEIAHQPLDFLRDLVQFTWSGGTTLILSYYYDDSLTFFGASDVTVDYTFFIAGAEVPEFTSQAELRLFVLTESGGQDPDDFLVTPTGAFAPGMDIPLASLNWDSIVDNPDPTDPPLTDTGTTDPDDIAGGTGPDTLSGGLGNDTVDGGAGDDDILGGVGFDALEGGAGNDTLVGQDGFDALSGGSGDDLLQGNNGLDTLAGGAGNDTLLGGLGSDTLLGDSGDDLLTGQSGFDSLDGGAGHDTLNGNSGADTLSGGADNDVLNGGIANDVLSGDAGDDTVNGGNGADMVSGGDGDDRLSGNSGSDTISGGTGSDVLLGGIGIDVFEFTLGDGHDRIGDFANNIDEVHLDADLLSEAAPVPDDLRTYASFNADGFLVLSFGADSLTFTNVFTTTAILDDVQFV